MKNGDLRWCYKRGEHYHYLEFGGLYTHASQVIVKPEPVLQQLKDGEWVDVPTILEGEERHRPSCFGDVAARSSPVHRAEACCDECSHANECEKITGI